MADVGRELVGLKTVNGKKSSCFINVVGDRAEPRRLCEYEIPFKSYERLGIEKGTKEATRDLRTRFPVGSPLTSYESFFNDVGGKCSLLNTAHDPNTIFCEYSYGVLVQTEWRAVIVFDPATRTSLKINMGFYFSGP